MAFAFETVLVLNGPGIAGSVQSQHDPVTGKWNDGPGFGGKAYRKCSSSTSFPLQTPVQIPGHDASTAGAFEVDLYVPLEKITYIAVLANGHRLSIAWDHADGDGHNLHVQELDIVGHPVGSPQTFTGVTVSLPAV